MRLFITAPSPYVRKCRIVIREKGLTDRVEEVVADPYANDPALVAANPIAQAPALLADDGQAFADSPLICAYLDSIGTGPKLIPESGEAHWRARRLEVLADAALEMGVKLVLEKRRPESERSPSWISRWTEGMNRALDALEHWDIQPEIYDLGVIATGVSVTWIGFRHPELDWQANRPGLVALQAALEQRPSFVETYPR
ncbi:MAG TPA: glutathione S-transferase N-terminal domain-containing protein [Caulobacteraceae bacterium]|nr:glutathione S-transferase N-terminal domain-containing protein [Caulobacteraceae bacterium]